MAAKNKSDKATADTAPEQSEGRTMEQDAPEAQTPPAPEQPAPEQDKAPEAEQEKTPDGEGKTPPAPAPMPEPEQTEELFSLAELADRHRLASWHSAALHKMMAWEPGKRVSEAEYAKALASLKNRRMGG